MSAVVLLDTGPLVALLNQRDQHHRWAREQFRATRPPQLTCESVLSEACFLLSQFEDGAERVMRLVERGVIAITFSLVEEHASITSLLARYRDVPMSLADACLVRMAEQFDRGEVLTLDHDFQVYRKHGRQVIPTRMPPA
jgi:predicted nucleic acid-binding protein